MAGLAIISNILGNYHALTAVLDDLESIEDCKTCSLGKVVGEGPSPNSCIRTVDSFDYKISNVLDRNVLKTNFTLTARKRLSDIFSWSVKEIKLEGLESVIEKWSAKAIIDNRVVCVSSDYFSSSNELGDGTWRPDSKVSKIFDKGGAQILATNQSPDFLFMRENRQSWEKDIRLFRKYKVENKLLLCPGSVGGLVNIGVANYCFILGNSIEFRAVAYSEMELLQKMFEQNLISKRDILTFSERAKKNKARLNLSINKSSDC